jgi:hypothetical protein
LAGPIMLEAMTPTRTSSLRSILRMLQRHPARCDWHVFRFLGPDADRRSRTFDLGDDAGRFCRPGLGGPSRGEIAFRPLERLTLQETHFQQAAVGQPGLSSTSV